MCFTASSIFGALFFKASDTSADAQGTFFLLLEFIFCFIKLITSWPLIHLQLHFGLDPDSFSPHSNVINRIVIRLFGKPWQSSTVDLSGLNFAFYVTWNTEMRKCK